ncbi:aromatic ring-hydroxylating dioxygenase subunit alpha [Pseudoroseicyclus sp. CXY001]|uniref:aromatic ring-hydroxylating oxygenase subunit alpha n=1 Tax=Pseudoroseicyclus sp. CXY001 TaxID=3242492 RepID=UPI00358DC9D4
MTSPLLDHSPASLPARSYRDAGWHEGELAAVWRQEWVAVGRRTDFPERTIRRRTIGGAEVIVVNDGKVLRAFHNVCRHRGSELCTADTPLGRLISCPYHAWAYAPDGRLMSTAFGTATPDFDRTEHGLLPVHLKIWNDVVFLSAAEEAPEFQTDVGTRTLANWPMESLRTGHRHEAIIQCNWKVFWENYSECLHCPGIHPGLSDMIPVYKLGVMAEAERSDGGAALPALKEGAMTWTEDGQPCGPPFPGLTEAERAEGHRFVTIWPSAYVVAHVDYVRLVRLEPLSPTETRLTAEWLFPEETLAQPGFDASAVARFATQVLNEDAAACEMNQRGLASPAFAAGRLMPQEYEIHAFHQWVLKRLARGGHAP